MPPATSYASEPAYAGRPFGIEHKLAGSLSWFVVAYCVWGILSFPGRFSVAVSIVMLYLLVRMVVTVVFSLRGDRLTKDWARRDWSDPSAVADLVAPRHPDAAPPFAAEDVHHVVLLPNYKESPGVLEATIAAIARQHDARGQVTLVLAMEANETGSAEKGAALAQEFGDAFAHVLVTVHPGHLPGEIPCKGSNQAWAAREAKRFVVDEFGIPLERVTVTSCDADSILHPEYLHAVGRMYAADSDRHSTFWQAPLFYYNNLWKVPFPVRFMAYITHALLMADLANPLTRPLPISTYTLSMKMLQDTGYWDPAVISEDWHIYLQCWFTRGGGINLRRVFLPVLADMPDGDSAWRALVNMYHQAVRHSWGAEDIGFVMQEWPGSGAPLLPTARLYWKVLRDHMMRSIPWFLFAAGSLLSYLTTHGGNPMLLHYPLLGLSLNTLWILSSVGLLALLVVELRRDPPPHLSDLPGHLFGLAIAWLLLPVISLAFGAIPALYAQTKLMLGLGLSWRVTPKRLESQLNES
jgi:Ca2+/Na+ antiporter